MSGSGGVSIARTAIRGENRFYNPPPMRRMQQEAQLQQQKQRREVEVEEEVLMDKERRVAPTRRRKGLGSEVCVGSSDSSGSDRVQSDGSNLDRFLEHTTPIVPAKFIPIRSKTRESERHTYFVMEDLWDSFAEWSAYGAGVPLHMHGTDSTVQYYVPFLSGIQLYAAALDPSKNDLDLSVSLRDQSIAGETEISSSPPGRLLFEYLEHEPPYAREPLANKVSDLASRFPELMTYRSCDLSPSSWVSVSWYPIYRIPVGPTLQNLDACFLTFHSLSTPPPPPPPQSAMGLSCSDSEPSIKLPLPTFGLASYKLKVSVWNQNRAQESEKIASLLQAANKWMKHLQVEHPDYKFFTSNTLQMR